MSALLMLVLLTFCTATLGSEPAASAAQGQQQPTAQPTDSLTSEEQMVRDIIARSFPSLEGVDIRLKVFRSDSDYFRTSFSAVRFIAGVRMRYFVSVNPEWRRQGAPVEGVRSILAHELAHVDDLRHGKRIRLVRLAGLLSRARSASFERRADLSAIIRDYGSGLKAYRSWLYGHIPPEKFTEKRRDYFSPEEIDAIVAAATQRPDLLDYWIHHVPMNLADIQSAR
jgi:hypothetical protein